MQIRSVIIMNDFCHVQGGASRVAVDEAVALSAMGVEVTFLGAVGPICNELRAPGIRTICLDQPELADVARQPAVVLQTLWNRTAYRTLQGLLTTLDRRRTIVHLHGYTKALTTTPALAASQAGFAAICTLHDFFAACPNGAFYDYRLQEPCRLRALSVSCALTSCDKRRTSHKAYRVMRGLAQRQLQRFPSSVRDYITLSDRSAAILKPYLPSSARFYPLANIIDVAPAPPVDVAANRTLAVVGRLDTEKGVELAARAANEAGLPIVFIGDGPRRQAIEATGAKVTGWLSADGVRRELDAVRCLVFPSLWYEAYGLVVAEAAARGVPAIVSDVAAPAERMIDGVDGWVFRSGDLEGLVRCMALTRDDASVAAAGAAAYRRHWDRKSSPNDHASALASIYDTVVADRGSV
jgi:glycosyltransferase involved in cell wall biosynthesis